MTAVGWVALAVLAAAVVWLVFAMIGLLREVAALRTELRAFSHAPIELAGGLPISRRPSGLRKTRFSSNSLAHRTTWLRSDL